MDRSLCYATSRHRLRPLAWRHRHLRTAIGSDRADRQYTGCHPPGSSRSTVMVMLVTTTSPALPFASDFCNPRYPRFAMLAIHRLRVTRVWRARWQGTELTNHLKKTERFSGLNGAPQRPKVGTQNIGELSYPYPDIASAVRLAMYCLLPVRWIIASRCKIEFDRHDELERCAFFAIGRLGKRLGALGERQGFPVEIRYPR